MDARRLDRVFAVLLIATALTWWLGEQGARGGAVMALVLGIAGIKCLLVILDFMALRAVQRLWPGLVIGWVAAVLLVIAGAYR